MLGSTVLGGTLAYAGDNDFTFFQPGHLLLSRSVFDSNTVITPGVTQLPPNCVAPNCVAAVAAGTYPTVFNNAMADASFGITAKIVLDELRPDGDFVQSFQVPNSSERDVTTGKDQMVTSFSSKSEIGLNLSTRSIVLVTFMGYLAPIDAIDVSNSNTPASRRSDQSSPGHRLSRRRRRRSVRPLPVHQDQRLQRQ